MQTLNAELTSNLKSSGASLVGFADLQEIAADFRNGYRFGISIAVTLDPNVIAGIIDGPNRLYYTEYKRANNLLNALGHEAVMFLQGKGQKAQSLAATNTGINWETFSMRLPHKTVATSAGLGWIGKSALLVTKKFGSALRFTTVLTDAELVVGEPVNIAQCGNCAACVDARPGHAISGTNWRVGISRDSIYDAVACQNMAGKFEKVRESIQDNICGICIAACPWTQEYIEQPR